MASTTTDPTAQILPGTHTIGEKSQIILFGATPTGKAASIDGAPLYLDLQFRLGARNAGVSIIDYTGTRPTVAEVEALAEVALAKLQTAAEQEAPDLSFHALRLAGADPSADAYVRLNGMTAPNAGESAEDRRFREELYGSARDVYRTFQFVPIDQDIANDTRVQHLLARFDDEAAATAYMTDILMVLEKDPTLNDVAVRASLPALGDESLAMTSTYISPDGRAWPVAWVVVRQGPLVSLITVRTPMEIAAPEAVDALAAAATACLASPGWCALVDIPPGLTPSAPPSP